MLKVRPAGVEDAKSLAPRLRPDDASECRTLMGCDPEQVLLAGLLGEAVSIYEEETGQVEAMAGVFDRGDSVGHVWLLSSTAFADNLSYAKQLLREFPAWVDRLQGDYALLANTIYRDNLSTIRLLRAAGFIFLPFDPWGGCYEFVRINPKWA